MAADPAHPTSTWRALLCGALLFVAADVVVFRSWAYGWLAKPDSSVGWVSRRLLWQPVLADPPTRPGVVLLGDSTMGEGCSPERLRELLGGPPVTVCDASVPATPMRVWPFLFTALAPPAGGWSVVVAGLSTYDDDGWPDTMRDRAEDVAFLGPLLRWSDLAEVAADFTAPTARRDLWLTAFCKTYAWRSDLQDLFTEPWQRYREVRRQLGRLRWGQPYEGVDHDLRGVHVEGDRIVGLRAQDEPAMALLRRAVWPPPAVDNTAYRRHWLGELADRTAANGAELVFVRMPLQVLPRARPRVPNTVVLDELAKRPHVRVLAFDLFADLERPEYFHDGLHLNRTARGLFTARLAEVLRAEFPEQFGR